MNALWTDWMNADLLTRPSAPCWERFWRFCQRRHRSMVSEGDRGSRQREERKRRPAGGNSSGRFGAVRRLGERRIVSTTRMDEVLRRRKLRTKDVTDTYELLRQLEAEERVRPLGGGTNARFRNSLALRLSGIPVGTGRIEAINWFSCFTSSGRRRRWRSAWAPSTN